MSFAPNCAMGQPTDEGACKVVMARAASDPPHWQPHIRNKSLREALAKRFRDLAAPLHWRHDGQW